LVGAALPLLAIPSMAILLKKWKILHFFILKNLSIKECILEELTLKNNKNNNSKGVYF